MQHITSLPRELFIGPALRPQSSAAEPPRHFVTHRLRFNGSKPQGARMPALRSRRSGRFEVVAKALAHGGDDRCAAQELLHHEDM